MSNQKTVSILGTEYQVIFKDYKDDPIFEKRSCDGYCDRVVKEIVLCNGKTHPNYEEESPEYCAKVERRVMRHEVIHAFLNESGLCDSTLQYCNGWSANEEMIDYFALQTPKITAVFRELGCEE